MNPESLSGARHVPGTPGRPARWRRAAALVGAVLVAGVIMIVTMAGSPPLPPHTEALPAIPGADSSLVRLATDPGARELEIVIGPVYLSARTPGYRVPIQLVRIPFGGTLHGFSWRITDGAGRELSRDLLHHVNILDPDQRDLFSNTARRVLAAGRETDAQAFPAIVGYPFAEGTRLLVVAMFANDGEEPVHSATLHLQLTYSPERRVARPLGIFPFSLDVMGPVGEKSFPVPPGRTVQSWEGSPAVDARILALGGHAHDFARVLRLEDVTNGKVMWEVEPVTDGDRLVSIPTSNRWRRGGIKLHRDRRYRVTVEYDNPTQAPTAHGGMGVIGGVAAVRAKWPPLRRDHPDYHTDLENVLSAPFRTGDDGHAHMH
jgi:hypothetical protein